MKSSIKTLFISLTKKQAFFIALMLFFAFNICLYFSLSYSASGTPTEYRNLQAGGNENKICGYLYDDGTFVFHSNVEESEMLSSKIKMPWNNNTSLRKKIKTISFEGNIELCTDSNNLFAQITTLESVNFTSNVDVSNVEDISFMFYECNKLTSIDFSNLNFSNLKKCTNLFTRCSKLADINLGNNFNTSAVEDFSGMFCSVNASTLDLHLLDTRNATDMGSMFADNSNLSNIILGPNFKTDNVTNMNRMFYNTGFTELDLDYLNTEKVTDMGSMFFNCSKLTSIDVSGFDTSLCENMESMFSSCKLLTSLDLSNFNTEKVITMKCMFQESTNLATITLGPNFKTNACEDMSYMFRSTKIINTEFLSNFDTSKVKNFEYMFYKCESMTTFNSQYIDTTSAEKLDFMFCSCNGLTTLNLSNFNTENVQSFRGMFSSSKYLRSIFLTSFKSTSATDVSQMFSSCTRLSTIEFSDDFTCDNVKDFSSIFYSCNALTQVPVSNFNTENAENMKSMFYGTKAKNLDLTNFNTAKVTNMESMFGGMTQIQTLDLSNFDINATTHVDFTYNWNTNSKKIILPRSIKEGVNIKIEIKGRGYVNGETFKGDYKTLPQKAPGLNYIVIMPLDELFLNRINYAENIDDVLDTLNNEDNLNILMTTYTDAYNVYSEASDSTKRDIAGYIYCKKEDEHYPSLNDVSNDIIDIGDAFPLAVSEGITTFNAGDTLNIEIASKKLNDLEYYWVVKKPITYLQFADRFKQYSGIDLSEISNNIDLVSQDEDYYYFSYTCNTNLYDGLFFNIPDVSLTNANKKVKFGAKTLDASSYKLNIFKEPAAYYAAANTTYNTQIDNYSEQLISFANNNAAHLKGLFDKKYDFKVPKYITTQEGDVFAEGDTLSISDLKTSDTGLYTLCARYINHDISFVATSDEVDISVTKKDITSSIILEDGTLIFNGQPQVLRATCTDYNVDFGYTVYKDNIALVDYDTFIASNPSELTNLDYLTMPSENGEYKVIATVKMNDYYYGEKEANFIIRNGKLQEVATVLDIEPVSYTGGLVKPEPTVLVNGNPLRLNIDYYLEYENNTNVTDNAYVIIKAMGEYKGEIRKQFEIKKMMINPANLIIGNSLLPVTKERDGNSNVTERLTIKYINPLNNNNVSFTYDSAVYHNGTNEVVKADNDNNIGIMAKGVKLANTYSNYDFDFVENSDVYFANVGKIMDKTSPTIIRISAEEKTFGLDQIITFTLETNEEIRLIGGESSKVSLLFKSRSGQKASNMTNDIALDYVKQGDEDVLSNTKTFTYKVKQNDMALNGLMISSINQLSGQFCDEYGNVLNTSNLRNIDRTNSTKIDTRNFTLNISKNIQANETSLPEVIYTLTFAEDIVNPSLDPACINVINGTITEFKKADNNNNTFIVKVTNTDIIGNEDRDGKMQTISVNEGIFTGISGNKNLEASCNILIKRTLKNVTSNILNGAIVHENEVVKFTAEEITEQIGYKLTDIAAVTMWAGHEIERTITSSLKDFYGVIASKNGWADSLPINFNFIIKNKDHVAKEVKDSKSKNEIIIILEDTRNINLLDLTNDEKLELDDNTILDFVSDVLYEVKDTLITNGESLENLIKEILKFKKEIDDLISILDADLADTNYEELMIKYEFFDEWKKEYLVKRYYSLVTSLREHYENYIAGNDTREILVYDKNLARETIEVFGVINNLDKENEADKVELIIERITEEEKTEKLEQILDDYKEEEEEILIPYDISIIKKIENENGDLISVPVKNDKKILVKLELPIEYYDGILNIYHVKDNGENVLVNTMQKKVQKVFGKCIAYFEADSFSPFIITSSIKTVIVEKEGDGTVSPCGLVPVINNQTSKSFNIIPNTNKKADIYAADVKQATITQSKVFTLNNITKNITLKVVFSEKEREEVASNNSIVTKFTSISIKDINHKSYMKGYPDKTFRPNNGITRQEVAAILARISDLYNDRIDYTKNMTFDDVKDTRWSKNYIGFVKEHNIINGAGNKFRPDDYMTRAEFATVITRMFNINNDYNITNKFIDTSNTWYDFAATMLKNTGYIEGYPGNIFDGKRIISRAEACKIINKILNRNISRDITDTYKAKVANKYSDIFDYDWFFKDILEASIDHNSAELH